MTETTLTREQVLGALKAVTTPDGGDIVSAGIVRALTVESGTVRFVLEIDPAQAEAWAEKIESGQ